jgi:predicted GIY-YIG superfamily endonuclease
MTNRSKTLYTGVSGDLENRVFEHKQGVKGEFAARYEDRPLGLLRAFRRHPRRTRTRETNQGTVTNQKDRTRRVHESGMERPQ